MKNEKIVAIASANVKSWPSLGHPPEAGSIGVGAKVSSVDRTGEARLTIRHVAGVLNPPGRAPGDLVADVTLSPRDAAAIGKGLCRLSGTWPDVESYRTALGAVRVQLDRSADWGENATDRARVAERESERVRRRLVSVQARADRLGDALGSILYRLPVGTIDQSVVDAARRALAEADPDGGMS